MLDSNMLLDSNMRRTCNGDLHDTELALTLVVEYSDTIKGQIRDKEGIRHCVILSHACLLGAL